MVIDNGFYIPMELEYVEPFSFDDYDDEYDYSDDNYTFAEIGYDSDGELGDKLGDYIFNYIKDYLEVDWGPIQIDADWIGIKIDPDEYDYNSDDVIRGYIGAIRNARKEFDIDIKGEIFKRERDGMDDKYTKLRYTI